ncbi:MAG: polysaccharide pyruvyl transferase family protein [Bryobacteraceae bacterium]|nr:polysaccharide pyruvyl transferase family protein [Bryobacteraceae bacterium]
MGERRWEVGICGTFDVANYGDLLFPLIAELELRERLGEVKVHRFSYHTKAPPAWAYEVTSVSSLPEIVHRLDGLLIGGGFLIRFDKDVAPGYSPPTPGIHHPTGYWLTPALIALQNNVPLIWNAPGMHCNDVPPWAIPLLERALTLSSYISVRDEPSRLAMARLTSAPVTVTPDTAFALTRLLELDAPPSPEYQRLCESSGLKSPYVLVQATQGLEGFARFVRKHREQLGNLQFLALPIGPVLGEREDNIDAGPTGVVRLSEWPRPLAIAELIGRSEAVVGHSYHLFITALTSGVPIFTKHNLATGKYCALQHFDTIFSLPADGEPQPDWFLTRLGRKPPSAAVLATYPPLASHWDRVADILRSGPTLTSIAMNRFLQTLPTLLEDAEISTAGSVGTLASEQAEYGQHLAEAERKLAAANVKQMEQQARLDNVKRQLSSACAEIALRDAHIAAILASASWRLTKPIRVIQRQLRKQEDGIC